MRYLLSAILIVVVNHACYADDSPDSYDQLYDLIMVRTAADGSVVSRDPVSPLLWDESKYLVSDSARATLVKALDSFNELSQEQVEAYPAVDRAILQHHVWTVFDWTASTSEIWQAPQKHSANGRSQLWEVPAA